MEKYYKLTEGKVINTVTTIPENMWERKKLLPYEKVINKILSDEENEVSNIEILEDKVIETITKYIIAPTLEEVKTKKINEINFLCRDEITIEYPLEKQSSANMGLYNVEYVDTMKSFIKERIDKSNSLIEQINLSETVEEVNLIEWN